MMEYNYAQRVEDLINSNNTNKEIEQGIIGIMQEIRELYPTLDLKTANKIECEYLKCIENLDFKNKNYHHALEDIANAEQILNRKKLNLDN